MSSTFLFFFGFASTSSRMVRLDPRRAYENIELNQKQTGIVYISYVVAAKQPVFQKIFFSYIEFYKIIKALKSTNLWPV